MLLNPRQKRKAERLRDLIALGKQLAQQDTSLRSTEVYGWIEDGIATSAFKANADNALVTSVGPRSPHYQHFAKFIESKSCRTHNEVEEIVGIMQGALNDLEGGYLVGQEHLIAAEIFDSLIEQAVALNSAGYKDPAAMLGRVVVEDALKRLAREEGISDSLKASVINDQLKDKVYPQPTWRQIQAWLDIGNSAAHGQFNEYTADQVTSMLRDIPTFLGMYFA